MSIQKSQGTLLASAARTACPSVITLNRDSCGGPAAALINMHIIIDVTVDPALASVQPTLKAVDSVSGKTYDLLAGIAAITAVGTTVLKVGKDIVAAAGLAAQDFIPEEVQLTMTHADGDSITYSVGINCEYGLSE